MGSPGGTVSEAPATLAWPHDFSHKGVSENIRETPIPLWYININIYIYIMIIYVYVYIYISIYIIYIYIYYVIFLRCKPFSDTPEHILFVGECCILSNILHSR